MTKLVSPEDIERIVGCKRHADKHFGRIVSSVDTSHRDGEYPHRQATIYILHSHACRDSGIDLRQCAYSRALDNGVTGAWTLQRHPTELVIIDNLLSIKDEGTQE